MPTTDIIMSKKEGRYYVEYLGWKESRGLFGREFTEPVIKELLARRRTAELPKMTVKVNDDELLISQEVAGKTGSRPEKTKYPAIPIKDTAFVIQGLYPDTDVVACVFLGYNPYTKCAIHVHVYRFDSETTAGMFVSHVNSIISDPVLKNRIMAIEKDLAEIGHVVLREQLDTMSRQVRHKRQSSEGSDGFSYGTHSPHSPDSMSPKYPTAEEALKKRQDIRITKSHKPIEPDKVTKRNFTSLHEELEYKMSLEDAPILLPPKDYDTIVRRHGKLEIRNELQNSRTILGPNGVFGNIEAESYNGQLEELSNGSGQAPDNGAANTLEEHPRVKKNSHSNGHYHPHGITRSKSDNVLQSPLRRQHSQASSDRSNNSDDMFADGLYQGYRPRKHGRSKSKESGKHHSDDLSAQLAMWSPSYSFGQTGIKNLPTHHEEETDTLNRTAPAGMLSNAQLSIPAADYGSAYTITPTHHVRRSQSHKQKGENGRNKYR